FLWKLNLRRIRVKHEYEMSKFEAEKLHEVDEMKSRFFANISHEFRTPLTLILGPAKDVLDVTKEAKTKQNVGLIKRNASRLLGLVNQLLDLSKLEAGRMKLETKEENIIPLLKGLVLSFTSLAERKKISLSFKAAEEKINVYIDRDKIEKILNNLLSNAFKFTPDGGKIDVEVKLPTPSVPLPGGDLGVGQRGLNNSSFVEISISDTGRGIPEENLDKIFDRFYQVNGSHTREQEGTGIGLALTKELVELHKGKIEVESEEEKGTTFVVSLPLGKAHLKPEEIVEEKTETEVQTTKEDFEPVTEAANRKDRTDFDVLIDTEKPLLLIVEDNSDVRKYIISHLEKNYRIQEAVDGEDGLKEAFNHIPDLIISDVMMPKMDGFELCNKLKTDERTSHIPIIMLTAKATSQDKISGYETGADDYIMKPFDAAELKVRIKNLIEIRRRLQEKFTKADFVIKRGEIKINRLDEKFIEKLMNIIEKHISEENFTIEEFESEIAMSKSQIYRKLKALTGKSPSRFVRSVRLSKARKMILEKQTTISEIAYSTGFGSPAYFTRCFKEEYGYSPSEIIK
ncbi:MAG: ATP-binding protein, partial [Ignavibacterium sp.]|nr:ATP-binding protein [Ignavibacterium sp.]